MSFAAILRWCRHARRPVPARITTPIKRNPPARMTAFGAVGVSLGYQFQPDSQHKFNILFYTQTLRSGYLEQGKRITLSPRNYWVRY